jgi:hypothetical protein
VTGKVLQSDPVSLAIKGGRWPYVRTCARYGSQGLEF